MSNKRIIIFIIVIAFSSVAFVGWNQIGRHGQFESAAWQGERGNYNGDNLRLYMISDLEQNYLKVGMSQRAVEQLLGEPDSIREALSVYDLGVSPYGIDGEFLEIKYDSDGNLVTTQWGQY